MLLLAKARSRTVTIFRLASRFLLCVSFTEINLDPTLRARARKFKRIALSHYSFSVREEFAFMTNHLCHSADTFIEIFNIASFRLFLFRLFKYGAIPF